MRRLVIAGAALALIAGCSEETDKRGIEVLPDMFHTPANKSQTAGSIEVDARDAQGQPIKRTVEYPAMMPPPEGTVPRSGEAYGIALADLASAQRNPDPLAPTPRVLKQGQRDYLTYCAPCHGRDGDASHGYIATYFTGIPSLTGLGIVSKADGEIYHVLTLGRGRMPSMRAQLPAERRWGVVQFVKLQARATVSEPDIAKMLADVDAEIAKQPDSEALKKRRYMIEAMDQQAKADMAAIAAAGDGHEYAPLPAAVPEYVGPTWPVSEAPK